ncbi:hypothetical protein C8R47DRAFT_1217423 [Mycena vitilis]|nr:hypothetical protein C8R47DRAFT_1217420 [Mycena vitilis]KAJ6483727.1 hypothetical protein C8R47DRAFT_1217421 [Mycena vitilis]KAJ6483728.1 hypothetical protein C8R47DRAFT_1217422 [Mycena vitilis]KAJ6483729.1 hypothetical protein C8R47DRAFT_1217423 [Mycena vitilis]
MASMDAPGPPTSPRPDLLSCTLHHPPEPTTVTDCVVAPAISLHDHSSATAITPLRPLLSPSQIDQLDFLGPPVSGTTHRLSKKERREKRDAAARGSHGTRTALQRTIRTLEKMTITAVGSIRNDSLSYPREAQDLLRAATREQIGELVVRGKSHMNYHVVAALYDRLPASILSRGTLSANLGAITTQIPRSRDVTLLGRKIQLPVLYSALQPVRREKSSGVGVSTTAKWEIRSGQVMARQLTSKANQSLSDLE